MFGRRLLPLLALAFGLRLLYGLAIAGDDPLLGDGLEFNQLAGLLADGHGYIQPGPFEASGREVPTADKPPLYPMVVALFMLVAGNGYEVQHVAGAVIGTATVAAVGLLGRRVGGDRVGLLAAALAAAYPLLIAADGSLRSESLYALMVALVLVAAYRLADRPTPARAAAAGVLIALATLTRSEAVLLLVLLVLPMALLAVDRGRALRLTCVAAAGCALVLAPWLARTWAAFDRPVFVSTNSGGLLAGANCEQTYHGDFLGQWVFDCLAPPESENEAEVSAALASDGIDYARDNAGRLPVVVAVRVLRTWELYRPRQQWHFEEFFEGRDRQVEKAGIAMYVLMVPLALFGALTLRRRGEPLRALAAMPVLVTLVSAGAYGFTRFRVGAEPVLVVLAALGIAALMDRRRGREPGPAGTAPAG